MRTISGVLGVSALLVSTTACGDHVSKREAERGWRSTQTAMASAGLWGSVSGSGSVGPDGASGEITGTFDCADGGSIDLLAQGEASSAGASATLEVEFNDCKVDRVVTNGMLDYASRVTAQDVFVSYAGELEWSGRAKGKCVVDASLTVGASGIFGSFSGDVCGYDWADIR